MFFFKSKQTPIQKLARNLKKLVSFVQAVATDGRIPEKDRKKLAVMIALIISPVDLIPNWIPVIGLLDDALLISLVLDHVFNHLDHEILMSHFPWKLKRFIQVRRIAQTVAGLIPDWARAQIWKLARSARK